MDLLISKLIPLYRFTWRDSNKVVSLSSKRRRSSSTMDRCQVCHANGWGFASQLGTLCFRNSDCLHVSIHGTSFSLLFSKLSKLLLLGLDRLGLQLGLGSPFVFARFTFRVCYHSTKPKLHSHCALLPHYKRWSNKVPNLKIHTWFCSYYLNHNFGYVI